MKNLNEFNVFELDKSSTKQINGGFIGWVAGALAGSFLYAVIEDWEGNVQAFKDGFNQTR